MSPETANSSTSRRWPRRILWIGLVWAALLIVIMGLNDDATPEDHTLALSIALSGGYTLLLRVTRHWWRSRLARRPLRSAMILGSVNAAVIETLFLAVEVALGASGVAAHPNLAIDLLLTMPWYIGMVIVFVRVQHWRRFDPAVVLLLGGLYECGADGLIGGAFEGAILSPAFFLLLPGVFFWLFIPVYSSMVLAPAWVIELAPPPESPPDSLPETGATPRGRRWLAPHPSGPAWRDAARPLLLLVPFAVYLLACLVIIGALSEVASETDLLRGSYGDLVMGATLHWAPGIEEQICGLVFRWQGVEDSLSVKLDRKNLVYFMARVDDEWQPFQKGIRGEIAVAEDTANQLILVARQDRFTIYANGVRVGEFEDDTFTSGHVGFYAAASGASPGDGCRFDDVWVWDLGQ